MFTRLDSIYFQLHTRIANLARNGAIRAIGLLVGGSVVAHAITTLAMPVNTRLYSPDDFMVLSVFSGLVGILAPVICLRFDAAIVIPDDDQEAANLLVLSIVCAGIVSICIWLLILFIPSWVYQQLKADTLEPIVWLVPLTLFMTGAYVAIQSWLVRRKNFGAMARSRAWQATAAAGSQIGLGYLGIAPLGLLVGHSLNYGLGSLLLLVGVLVAHWDLLRNVSFRNLILAFKQYDNFPRFSVWAGLANGLSNSAPLLIIAAMSPGPEAGYLALSMFALLAPLALVGNAVGQVYLSGAPKAHREGRLDAYTAETLNGLVRASAGPMLFGAMVSPVLFGLIFGDAWIRSGVLVTWMTPWCFLQFLSAPISNVLLITGRQRTTMVFHLFGLVLRVGSVLVAGFIANSILSEVWAVTGWIFYAAYLVVIFHSIRLNLTTFTNALWKSIPSILLAGTLGFGVVFLATLFRS